MRLGDTDLILTVEKDYAVHGEELKFGGFVSQLFYLNFFLGLIFLPVRWKSHS